MPKLFCHITVHFARDGQDIKLVGYPALVLGRISNRILIFFLQNPEHNTCPDTGYKAGYPAHPCTYGMLVLLEKTHARLILPGMGIKRIN